MPAPYWTAQLHIADGSASEHAPEIAYAERQDDRGRSVALYVLAEPARTGGDRFVEELVNRIGEEFLLAEGSLTGSLQQILLARHEELLDWNRNSLPADQVTYGVSCLLVRDRDGYLAQAGPSLAIVRQDGRVTRLAPVTERSRTPLGAPELAAPEFTPVSLTDDDLVLLISSDADAALPEEADDAVAGAPAESVLAGLYPLLHTLPRLSALIVAPDAAAAARTAAAPVDNGQTDEADSPFAPAAPSVDGSAVPESPETHRGASERSKMEPPAPPSIVPSPPPEPEDSDLYDVLEPDFGDEYDDSDDRTSVGEAFGGLWSGLAGALGGLFRRMVGSAQRHPADDAGDPWDVAPDADADPWEADPWEDGPHDERTDDDVADAPDAAFTDEDTPDDEWDDRAADDLSDGSSDEDDNPPPSGGAQLGFPDPPADLASPADPDSPADGNEDGDADAAPDPAGGAPTPGERTQEFTLARGAPPPVRMKPQAAGWPTNPFSSPAAPVLTHGPDVDASQRPQPLVGLRSGVPTLRRRVVQARERHGGAFSGPAGRGPVALGLGAMLLILVAVGGILLIPDLIGEGERSRFDDLLDSGRRGLAAATLAEEPALTRAELESALLAAEEAVALRPDDAGALALAQEIRVAIRDVNAVVRPEGLTVVFDFRDQVAPPFALAHLQIGGETAYLLDDSGGRVFAYPLAGGAPEVIFQPGERYRVVGLFDGPTAAEAISMQWAATPGGVALIILDAERRLYRYTPAAGVQALEIPQPEVLGSLDAVAISGGDLYLLDVTGGAIWRYILSPDGTLTLQGEALARTDLTGATAIAVDADAIYVSSSDGRLRRFTEGGEQGFAVVGLDRPLLVPAALSVAEGSGRIYAADRGNGRVVVITPSGELAAQIRGDLLGDVRGVAPDERADRIYYVTPDALLTSVLPEIAVR